MREGRASPRAAPHVFINKVSGVFELLANSPLTNFGQAIG